MNLASVKLPMRLAWRSVWRRPRRSMALFAAFFLPLTIACVLSVLISTSALTTGERETLALGHAQARVLHDDLAALAPLEAIATGQARLRALLGAEVADTMPAEVEAPLIATASGRTISLAATGITDPGSAVTVGRFPLREGTVPSSPGEMAISESAAARLHVEVGEEFVVGEGDRAQTVTLSGTIVDPRDTQRAWGVTSAQVVAGSASAQSPGTVMWLIPPDTRADLSVLAGDGWVITDRAASAGNPDPIQNGLNAVLIPALIVVLAFAALLTGAGFAIGASENSQDLGLLGVVGATRRTGGLVLLFQGVFIGAGAAVAAVAAGLGLAAVLGSPVAGWFSQIWGPLHPDWRILAAIAVLGVLTCLATCALATRRVRRMEPLPALRGVPADIETSGSRAARQIALCAGVGLILVVALMARPGAEALTPVAGLLAVTVIGSGFLAVHQYLARAADRAPLTLRLAMRTTMLAPGRVSAQVTAVAAVVLVAGVVITSLGGLTQKMSESYPKVLPAGAAMLNTNSLAPQAVLDEVTAILDRSEPPVPITYGVWASGGLVNLDSSTFRCERYAGPCDGASTFPAEPQKVGVTTTTGVEAVLQRPLTSREREGWAAGKVLVLAPELLDSNGDAAEFGYDGSHAPRTVSGILADRVTHYSGSELPNAYVDESVLDSSIKAGEQVMLYFPPAGSEVTTDQQDRINNLVSETVANGGYLYVDRGPPAVQAIGTIYLVTAIAAAVLATLITALTAQLSIADMMPELRVLAEVGAPRASRRRLTAFIATVVSTLGVVAGIAATGLLYPAVASALETSGAGKAWLVLTGIGVVTAIAGAASGWLMAPSAGASMPHRG